MELRVYEFDNGVVLDDVEMLETKVIVTDETKDELYREIGKRILAEWGSVRNLAECEGLWGVVIDVKFKGIDGYPLVRNDDGDD